MKAGSRRLGGWCCAVCERFFLPTLIGTAVGNIFRGVSGKGLVSITVWGASFAVVRFALDTFNPFALVALRFSAGAALLFFILRVRGMHPYRPAPILVFARFWDSSSAATC